MAFGDGKQVDHEAEAAEQAAIAEEVVQDEPQDAPVEEPEATDVAGEPEAEVEEPVVTVQRAVDEPVHIRVAGYVIDLTEDTEVPEVPQSVADDLAESPYVEVVA